MPKYKIARIASDIQRYLGDILINEVNDEILKHITITGCDLTNDLSYCKVYFTSFDNLDIKSLEKEVKKGFECGITLEKFNDFKEGDTIEVYEMIEVKHA